MMDIRNSFGEMMQLTDDEIRAQGIFYEWYHENKMHSSQENLPANIRPQGLTVDIPEILTEDIIFRPGYDIALTRHPRYFTSVPHSHSFYEIVYVCNGYCRQLIDNKEFGLNTGNVCILPPGIMHSPEAFGPGDIVINLQIRKDAFICMFEGLTVHESLISDFFSHALYQQSPKHYLIFSTGTDFEPMEIIFNMLQEYKEGSYYSAQILKAYATIFMAKLLRDYGSKAMVYSMTANEINATIVPMLQYIQDHFADVTLTLLAKEFNYNQAYLSRMIKKYTGRSFTQYLRSFRMQKATSLLKNSELPITEIAHMLGYSSMSEFYRVFYEKYSKTPKNYREESTI